MGKPFLGEIKIMSFNYAPQGWAMCNGQFLPINQNQALFSLLGTMYGGNGQTNFALPDLRGQTPIHVGGSFNVQGQKGGEQAHTLTDSGDADAHHIAQASTTNQATRGDPPAPCWLGQALNLYQANVASLTTLIPATVTQRRRQPGAPEHAAVPDAELLHRA